jgi:hypothetical protein
VVETALHTGGLEKGFLPGKDKQSKKAAKRGQTYWMNMTIKQAGTQDKAMRKERIESYRRWRSGLSGIGHWGLQYRLGRGKIPA